MFRMAVTDAYLIPEGKRRRLMAVGLMDGALRSGEQVCMEEAPEYVFQVSVQMINFGGKFDPRRIALGLVPSNTVEPDFLVGKTLVTAPPA